MPAIAFNPGALPRTRTPEIADKAMAATACESRPMAATELIDKLGLNNDEKEKVYSRNAKQLLKL